MSARHHAPGTVAPPARPLLLLVLASLLGAPSAAERAVREVVVGSCLDQRRPAPLLAAVAAREPDLLLMLGDNIYSDTREPAVMAANYRLLAEHPDVTAARRASARVLATWDDHDYGENDAGARYPMKRESERLFEDFWYPDPGDPRRNRDGVYGSAIIGPPGRRLQVILLDTRFFRSPDHLGDLREATVLGAEQWAWLTAELQRPAELRLLCSSIQVVADSHRFEKWADFPHERQRLFDLLRASGAEHLVICSGDRHLGTLLRHDDALPYPLYDLTASGLNTRTYADDPDPKRIGTPCSDQHYAVLSIDWDAGALTMALYTAAEDPHLVHRIPFAELERPAEP